MAMNPLLPSHDLVANDDGTAPRSRAARLAASAAAAARALSDRTATATTTHRQETHEKAGMTMNTATSHPASTSMHRGMRRALALVVALVLASLAFGVGLPWIIVDAPPGPETLWAREVQSRAPAALPLVAPTAARRSASPRAIR